MTLTLDPHTTVDPTADLRPPPPSRLVRVELRKAVDTRAGAWLLVGIAAVAVGSGIAAGLAGSAHHHTFTNISGIIQESTSLILPVLGILLVTSEWSQRTALQTFALVPRRGAIVRAKLAAGILLSLAVAAFGLLVATAATAIATHQAGVSPWHSGPEVIGVGLLYQVLSVLGGMAFGLLFLNSPVAIVANYVLSLVWTILTGSIAALAGAQHWLDQSYSSGNLLDNALTLERWAQLGVASLVWIAVPLVAGLWRLQRKPIA